jgi:methyl-accepting chemotaxis protein PixJ
MVMNKSHLNESSDASEEVPTLSDPNHNGSASSSGSPELRYRGVLVNSVALSKPKASVIENILRLNWSGLSLRIKATALAIALGVFPTVLVGGGAYVLESKVLKEEVTKTHQTRANEAIDKLTRFIFERYGDVQTLANLPILRNSSLSASVSLKDKQKVRIRWQSDCQWGQRKSTCK